MALEATPSTIASMQPEQVRTPEMAEFLRLRKVMEATRAINKRLFYNEDRLEKALQAEVKSPWEAVSRENKTATLAANDYIHRLTMSINDAALAGAVGNIEIGVDLADFARRVGPPHDVLFYQEGSSEPRQHITHLNVLRQALGGEVQLKGDRSINPDIVSSKTSNEKLSGEGHVSAIEPLDIPGMAMVIEYDQDGWGEQSNVTIKLVGKNKIPQGKAPNNSQ
jgi:hypothetical protein